MADDSERRLQRTIDRLALELAEEKRDHERTKEERDSWKRRARRWRWIAELIHAARQPSKEAP